MDDKEKLFVDELLSASLRRYARGEARPGLEGRILAGVRARQQAERRRNAWAWTTAIAGAMALVAVMVLSRLCRLSPRLSPSSRHQPSQRTFRVLTSRFGTDQSITQCPTGWTRAHNNFLRPGR